jgi:hypothetical protein
MGLLGFFRKEKRVHTDPELGALTYNERSSFWEGETEFPDGREPIVVAIPGDENGPSPHARAMYDELKRRYPTLRDEVAKSLYELYDNYRSDATEIDYQNELPRLSTAAEIWETTSLDDITFWGDEPGGFQVELTYTFDWHSDHMFGVRLEDWKVSGVSIDG